MINCSECDKLTWLHEVPATHPVKHYAQRRGIPEKHFHYLMASNNLYDAILALRSVYSRIDVGSFTWGNSSLNTLPSEQSFEAIDIASEESQESFGLRGPFLIFPFFQSDGQCTHLCARQISDAVDKHLRFVNISVGAIEEQKRFYNITTIQKGSPIFICEGLADSLFLKNSCCFHGLLNLKKFLSSEDFLALSGEDLYFILDNEYLDPLCMLAHEEIRKTAYGLFLWPYLCNAKDLADFASMRDHKYSIEEFIVRRSYTSVSKHQLRLRTLFARGKQLFGKVFVPKT